MGTFRALTTWSNNNSSVFIYLKTQHLKVNHKESTKNDSLKLLLTEKLHIS